MKAARAECVSDLSIGGNATSIHKETRHSLSIGDTYNSLPKALHDHLSSEHKQFLRLDVILLLGCGCVC